VKFLFYFLGMKKHLKEPFGVALRTTIKYSCLPARRIDHLDSLGMQGPARRVQLPWSAHRNVDEKTGSPVTCWTSRRHGEVKDVALANGGKQLYLILPGQNFLSSRI
jgi:hypothetical protein